MPKKTILIGIPCFDGVPADTLEDYMRFAYYLGRRYTEYNFCLAIKAKTEQFRARNAIVQEALKVNADYLFFLDDDHIIDVDGMLGPSAKYEFLRKMIEHDKDIVGGLYWQRGGTYSPVALNRVDDIQYRLLEPFEITGDLQKVDVVGGGCMLINMDVFEKIDEPYFEPEHTYSTDIQLCRAAAEKGCEVWLDSSIEIGHVVKERAVLHSGNINAHKQERKERIQRQQNPESFGFTKEEVPPPKSLGHVMQGFTIDVAEYLGVDVEELGEIANKYNAHQKKFKEYEKKGNLEDYYREAGKSYLARACFIHSIEQNKPFDNFVLNGLNKEKCGIDFGCGSAPISFELARKGHDIWFKDIDGNPCYEFLKWRADRYDVKTAHFDEEWPDNMDYVLCLDSIEHIKEWRELVDNISNSLKPQGVLINNFIMLGDSDNDEHVFMDKPAFLKYAAERGLWSISPGVFQKRDDITETVRGENNVSN
jgi:2-polyprenyl-3-methyl-5-hydroxy-6-metoxy-1,4-benzoquinol methylase